MPAKLSLVHDVLRDITSVFDVGGVSNPKREAEDLLCDFLGCSRAELYLGEKTFGLEIKRGVIQEGVERRLRGEPLPYISGKVEFYHCKIELSPAVLIPRPETEILVDKIIAYLKKEDLQGKVLLDVCCGSGCIGIAIKKEFPDLCVYVSDCSKEAVDLAAHNAELNQVRVVCLQGDLFSPFMGHRAHYIVSNPPYISEDEYQILSPEVKEYEPRQALVAGADGLEFYRRFALDLPGVLFPKGCAWFELGYRQGEAVQSLFQASPWIRSEVENDWAGHNRFFFLEIE